LTRERRERAIIVRSRRFFRRGVRPLKRDVRGRTGISRVSYAAILIFTEGPCVVLAVLGILLFKRYRTLATSAIALGFVVVALTQLLSIYGPHAATQIYKAGGMSAALHSAWFGWIPNVTLWAGAVGSWLGSLGLLWHTLGKPPGTSPNQRLERP